MFNKAKEKNKKKPFFEKSALASHLESNLKQKLATDQRANVSEKDSVIDDNNKNNKLAKLTFKQKWQSQIVDQEVVKEVKNYKQILQICLGASLFASNSVVYGSSSAMFASQHSSFEKIVNRCCDLFSPKSFLDFCWKLLWFLPFLLTFLIIFSVAYTITSIAYTNGYELLMIFMMLGINVLGIGTILLLPKYRPTTLINKQSFSSDKIKLWHLMLLLFIFVLLFTLAFVARFAWKESYPSGFVNFDQYVNVVGSDNVAPSSYSTVEASYALQILASGFLCGLVFFIPGLSGSFILSGIGANTPINMAFRYAFAGYNPSSTYLIINSNWAWTTIVVAFIGLLSGFVTSCFATRFILQKYKNSFNILSFASTIILPIVVLITLPSLSYNTLGKDSNLLIGSLVILFLVLLIGSLGIWFYAHKKKYSFNWMWATNNNS